MSSVLTYFSVLRLAILLEGVTRSTIQRGRRGFCFKDALGWDTLCISSQITSPHLHCKHWCFRILVAFHQQNRAVEIGILPYV
ncbi:uncharacterized protein BDW47DRAFT_103723 [Aspergillus candidus]|uniref:Secreted protein n=1 Tax=Aspergillus candidus TaxID=41067 RepID=A0A2I2FEQ0_ASPCN|nr:hypothetical protein BDW47DRAFT_103723 [Aspergillus candidus]PLB39121.1 hypothetical protein BDW47DRAFT_103723 [Aspergillus candidus]